MDMREEIEVEDVEEDTLELELNKDEDEKEDWDCGTRFVDVVAVESRVEGWGIY
jgi:hypothetical protein